MGKVKDVVNQEHHGFAVTMEVLCTLAMMFMFLNMILYMLKVMDVQRYMNTVMTSTAAQASRWGGANTRAYKENVSNIPLITTAQQQLNYVASNFNPQIVASPGTISYDSEKITVTVRYGLPPIFQTMSRVNGPGGSYDMYNQTRSMSMSVSVGSIMESGRLL